MEVTLVISSGDDGISRHQLTDHGWDHTIIEPELSNSHSFALYGQGVFFICNNDAYRLSADLEMVIPVPFQREELLFRLIPMDRELYLITEEQVYRYEEGEETFLPLEKDNKARILSVSDIIIPDESDGYWMVRHQGKYKSRVMHTNASAAFEEDHRSYPVLQNLGEVIDLNTRDSILFLTGLNKVSLFDLTVLSTGVSPLSTRIEPLGDFRKGTSAGFHFAGLEFQSSPEPVFRYRLIPAQESWSEWGTRREVIFDRLKPGSYSLTMAGERPVWEDFNTCRFPVYNQCPFLPVLVCLCGLRTGIPYPLFLFQKWRLLGYQRAESRVSQRMQIKAG